MFEGFPKDSIKFFKELSKNNDREWFAEHKSWYEEVVLDPALALVTDMAAPLKKISPHFVAIPKRSGGSLMRIYRDTRFSKDKTPYKTNLGVQFRHEVGKDVHAPGFYFSYRQRRHLYRCRNLAPRQPDTKTNPRIDRRRLQTLETCHQRQAIQEHLRASRR